MKGGDNRPTLGEAARASWDAVWETRAQWLGYSKAPVVFSSINSYIWKEIEADWKVERMAQGSPVILCSH